MEEKLNRIYEKLLDIEIMLKREKIDKTIKEFEAKEREDRGRLEELHYEMCKQNENWNEEMTIFRNLKELKEIKQEGLI